MLGDLLGDFAGGFLSARTQNVVGFFCWIFRNLVGSILILLDFLKTIDMTNASLVGIDLIRPSRNLVGFLVGFST